jgi:hypothetical protein
VNPRYPIYVPSKGRHESRLTSKALEKMGVPYRIVVEPQELELYASVIAREKILVLPESGKGLPFSRNWCWEHSIREGHEWHWQLDDNISGFRRAWKCKKIRVMDGATFAAIEDFCDRYLNVAHAGMDYSMFASPGKVSAGPYLLNTRIYSCHLIRNSIPFRFRGWYNDDTDLSLRELKAGWCTVLFRGFTCDKARTMTVKGGLVHDYRTEGDFDGRLEMAKSLVRQHPDVTTIHRRWGRWQHKVDYSRFRGNKLKLRPGIVIPEGVDEFGMQLVVRKTGESLPLS